MKRLELEKILCTDIPELQGKEIWIWGAGNTAQLYQEGLKRLSEEGFFITGYCDNDPLKYTVDAGFNSLPVISPAELEKKENIIVLICTAIPKIYESIGKQLTKMNKEWYSLDEAIMKLHREQVLQCYDLLEDDLSKEIYAAVILFRMKGGILQYEPNCEDRYYAIAPFKMIDDAEVYIDCGAYVGDSIEKYIWRREGAFKKIIAFEPNKKNYCAMSKRVERLKSEWNIEKEDICLYAYGVGDEEIYGNLENYDVNHGLSSKFIDKDMVGDEVCRIVSLDTFIEEPFSFIKADIESYEYKMLCGAKEGIKKWKPLLAIAIYHNGVDMYDIPLLIKNICPEYKIAIRHHSYGWGDTVVYAYI